MTLWKAGPGPTDLRDLHPCPEIVSQKSVFQETDKMLEQFVTSNSRVLFTQLNLPLGFLSSDPGMWNENEDYQKACPTVAGFQIVNDNEQSKLFKAFNKKLTKGQGAVAIHTTSC